MNVVVVDEPAPGVRRVLINRPEFRNAIDVEARVAVGDAVAAALDEPAVRAIVLGGVQGVFCAGGDLSSLAGISPEAARHRMEAARRTTEIIWHAPKPVVTALEGFAAGGGAGLALLADWIVMGRGARILFPFLKLGLVPDLGLMATLPLRAGRAAANRLFLTNGSLTGEAALAAGIADSVVEDAEVMAAAVAEASRLADLPLAAFARLKAVQRPAGSLGMDDEVEAQIAGMLGAEFREGLAAFREKRPPDFRRLPS